MWVSKFKFGTLKAIAKYVLFQLEKRKHDSKL